MKFAALPLAFLLALSSCSRPRSVEAQTVQAGGATTVAVAKAGIEDLSRQIVLTAEFKPFQEIEVLSKVAGFVKTIHVDVGDRVKQGQLLALLEVPEMADDQTRAQSMVSRSQAEVARARDELQRAESARSIALLSFNRLSQVAKQKKGLIAQQEIDDSQSRLLIAEAQVNAAKSNLSAAEQQVHVSSAELQKTKTLLEYVRVTAPFAGVVTKRYANTGSMIQAGTSSSTQVMPLVRLSDNSLLRLILPVPESAVPAVRLGQQVSIHVSTLNRTFVGRFARFADRISSTTRTMDTEVDVPNPDLVLIPGMYAEVNLTLERRDKALTVPIPAIEFGSEESSGRVFVVTPQNKVDIRKVRVGLQTPTNAEIRSGLHEGDLVITANRGSLHAGDVVHPKLAEPAPRATH
ncbi:MAG: efflux RND transporter periplasmic adaptor subunit [Candidatus Solibacter usitatus]|nr:efflux RND transporter periplasmic adaptor subunit [Candidatus Solibacter usitatus]